MEVAESTSVEFLDGTGVEYGEVPTWWWTCSTVLIIPEVVTSELRLSGNVVCLF